MRVLLVGAELEENLALRYLWAALQRKGHSVAATAFGGENDTDTVLGEMRRHRPDLIGLSITFQRRAHEFGRLAQALRQGGYAGHMTCGGHFATFAHQALLERYPAIDSVVRHEGEETLPELCASLERDHGDLSKVRGLVFRDGQGGLTVSAPRPLCPDLDALAFPVRPGEAPQHLGIPTAFLVGSRGCYGHCTFCSIHAFIGEAGGPRYRARSVLNLADEIEQLRRQRGARLLIFHDDDFFTRDRDRDLRRVTSLRDELFRRKLTDLALVVKARPDDVDPEVFRVLREIGLLRVYLGIESGSTQGLRTLGRGVDLAQNRRALAYLLDTGVYACFNMLLFDPDSTMTSLYESLSLMREAAHVPMNFCRTEIYVGTPLMRRLEKEGRLIGDEFGWDYHIADARAETAFRIFAHVFYERNFRPDGLMNSNLGLGYHLHLLRHFYPHAVTPALRARAEATISRVNLDSVAWLDRIFDFADSGNEDEEAFAEELAVEVNAATRVLEDEVEDATRALIAAARAPQRRPSSTWRTMTVGALALPLAVCVLKRPVTPPPDPPPPPHDETSEPRRPNPPEPILMPPDPPPPPTDVQIPHDSPPPPTKVVVPHDPPPPPHGGRRGHGKTKPPQPMPSPHPVPMPPDPPPPPHRAR
jgi:anaerobic magnesium-protoporphyrin IX monomethyl ester cyclase